MLFFLEILEHLILEFYPKKVNLWDFPGSPVVKTLLSSQGVSVSSMVGELTSCMWWGGAKYKINKNNKFIKRKKLAITKKVNIINGRQGPGKG